MRDGVAALFPTTMLLPFCLKLFRFVVASFVVNIP